MENFWRKQNLRTFYEDNFVSNKWHNRYHPISLEEDFIQINDERQKEIKYDMSYLNIANEWGQNSFAKRIKVGAVIVKDNRIISDGINGTPAGMPNQCEDENNKTYWYVLHAESNALSKCSAGNGGSLGATLYCSYSPCQECSKSIIQAGIKKVVFENFYRITSGLDLLYDVGIEIIQYNLSMHNKIREFINENH